MFDMEIPELSMLDLDSDVPPPLLSPTLPPVFDSETGEFSGLGIHIEGGTGAEDKRPADVGTVLKYRSNDVKNERTRDRKIVVLRLPLYKKEVAKLVARSDSSKTSQPISKGATVKSDPRKDDRFDAKENLRERELLRKLKDQEKEFEQKRLKLDQREAELQRKLEQRENELQQKLERREAESQRKSDQRETELQRKIDSHERDWDKRMKQLKERARELDRKLQQHEQEIEKENERKASSRTIEKEESKLSQISISPTKIDEVAVTPPPSAFALAAAASEGAATPDTPSTKKSTLAQYNSKRRAAGEESPASNSAKTAADHQANSKTSSTGGAKSTLQRRNSSNSSSNAASNNRKALQLLEAKVQRWISLATSHKHAADRQKETSDYKQASLLAMDALLYGSFF